MPTSTRTTIDRTEHVPRSIIPAGGWYAVYIDTTAFEGEPFCELLHEPLVCWALGYTEEQVATVYDDTITSGPWRTVRREREVVGYVSGDGLVRPATDASNFCGYIHQSGLSEIRHTFADDIDVAIENYRKRHPKEGTNG